MGDLTFTKMTKPADPSFTCGISSIDKMVKDSYFLCLLKRSYAYEVTAEGKVVAYYRIELRRFDNSKFDPPWMSIRLIYTMTCMRYTFSILQFAKIFRGII